MKNFDEKIGDIEKKSQYIEVEERLNIIYFKNSVLKSIMRILSNIIMLSEKPNNSKYKTNHVY